MAPTESKRYESKIYPPNHRNGRPIVIIVTMRKKLQLVLTITIVSGVEIEMMNEDIEGSVPDHPLSPQLYPRLHLQKHLH